MAIVLEAPEEKKSRFVIEPPEKPQQPASVSTKPVRQQPIPIRQHMRQQAFEQELSPAAPSPTPRFTIEPPAARSLPRYNRGEAPEGGLLGQAYRGYRQLPWIQRFNVEAAKVPQAIRERFLPEQPIVDPATGKVTQINVPLETLKGTTREVAATFLNFDTDVIAGLVAAGPLFRMLGGLTLPAGQTLKQVFNTSVGRRFFSRAFLPKPIQARSAAAATEGFRPESVLIPPTPVTIEEAAEAAKQGAAQILAERPLSPEEILELYKIRYGVIPEPKLPTAPPVAPPVRPLLLSPSSPSESREPTTAFGRLLKQQMSEIEQVPLHPAKAGRAALKNIFGDQAGFVALPEDEDALNAMLQATKLGVAQTLPKFAENINLSRINDVALRATMKDYIEQRPGVATTPHITNEELIKRASILKDTPIIKQLASLPEGTLESQALRNRQESLGVIQKALENTVGETFKSEMDTAIQQYRQPASVFARALQAQSIPAEAKQGLVGLLDKRIATILKDPVLGKDVALLGKLKALRTDLAGFEALTPDLLDKIYFVWLNSILSNPFTHAVNRLSNFVFRWQKIPERFFQAAIDVPASFVAGKREVFFGEVPAMLRGLRAKPTVPIAHSTKLGLYGNPFGESRGARLIGIPLELLNREDEISKRLVGQMELYAQTYRESAKLGVKGLDATIVQQTILANPSEALMSRVAKEQLYRTFQDAPSNVAKWLMSGRQQVVGLKYVIPFLRTPDRIFHAGLLERTPLQLARMARRIFRWKKIGDSYTQEEFTHDASILALSSAVSGFMGYQYLKGNVTGKAPTNPGDKAAFYASGKRPFAARIGNMWIPFSRLEPWGTSIAAVIGTIQDYADSDTEVPTDRILTALAGMAKFMTNKTYLSGLSNTINGLSDPERFGGRLVSQTAAGFVPASGLSAMLARIQNPYYLDPQGVRETIMSRIPFLSERVPKKLGRFGESQPRPVLDIGMEQVSRVDKALNDLGHHIGFPDRSIGVRKLTNEEYNELLEIAGPLSYNTLDRMVNHPAYQVLSVEEKMKEIDAVVREDREVARERIRIRIISRELRKANTTKERQVMLGKLKDQKVLTSELYFEFKDRGLIQ